MKLSRPYGRFCVRLITVSVDVEVAAKVYPSAGALATAAIATAPLAPDLLTITIGAPRRADRRGSMMRMPMSNEPPAGAGTIRWTGCAGNLSSAERPVHVPCARDRSTAGMAPRAGH